MSALLWCCVKCSASSLTAAAIQDVKGFSMVDLTINTDLARKILTGFIHTEITRAGFSKAVINLSGGIDSALSCYLAAEALGPKNVLAIRLPYRTSSPESLEHAQLVIDDLGVESMTVEITDMVEPLFAHFPEMDSMRKGNIMARERMIVLYDQSAAFNGLAVGTGNKTEILLGYTTLYGDSANALNPIGDLYKTQVRQLSRAMGVPQVIIDKPPSADLWVGQTDEGELGFTYATVDELLYLLVDERYTPEECVQAGFPENFVHKVVDRIRRNQFKRILPPIAKLSNRTIGYDFLYLRDWGT
jgi:NAD+ synthase